MWHYECREYSFDERLQAAVADRRRELLQAALAVSRQDEAAEEHGKIRGDMIQSVFQSDMQLFQAVKLAELARQNEYIRLRKVEVRMDGKHPKILLVCALGVHDFRRGLLCNHTHTGTHLIPCAA